jgi:cytochrome c-type biogenesis protein CcmH
MRVLWVGLLFIMSSMSCAQTMYPLDSHKQEAQFEHLLKELRCLVCQNQDLSDSNAELAKDLRSQVYQLVKAGNSDTEILTFLTERYGDFILFNPPVKPLTWLLWSGPLLFSLTGLLLFWRSCIKRRQISCS